MIKRQYQTLAEAAFEGVAVVEELQITDANQQLVELLGYDSRDELIGESFENFLPPEDVDEVSHQIQRSVDVDVATLEQQRLVRKDGSELIAELRGKLLHDDQTTCSILVIRDVTEWEHAERQLKTAYADLEQFSHIASHDLRAPLRALDNLSQWVIEDLGDSIPEESANHLRLMRERIKRMEQLLNDLLRYARATAEDVELEMADVDEIIEQAIDSVDVPAPMNVEVVGDLPVLETARTPLKQVFVNLISNADLSS
jgi:PAS domain S-box-containing protein